MKSLCRWMPNLNEERRQYVNAMVSIPCQIDCVRRKIDKARYGEGLTGVEVELSPPPAPAPTWPPAAPLASAVSLALAAEFA